MEHVASSIDQLAAALTVKSAGGTAASPECKQATTVIHQVLGCYDLLGNLIFLTQQLNLWSWSFLQLI